MENEIESLASTISMLTDKLDGVGIEIYHLSDSISTLASRLEDLLSKKDDVIYE